jgi:hypothetical protein
MSLVELKGRVDAAQVLRRLNEVPLRRGSLQGVTFRFRLNAKPTVGAVALLAAWMLADRAAGGVPRLSGDSAVQDHLRNLDAHAVLGMGARFCGATSLAGFVPITPITGAHEVNAAVNALCDLVLRNAEKADAVLPAIEWAANEVTDNVDLHASAATPGIFFAHLDVRRQRLEMAVVDQGIGVRRSLGSAIQAGSDGDAISKALQRGVTRDTRIGQGNGLAGTREIIVENGGDLTIWSGDALFRIVDGEERGFIGVPRSAGTGVVLEFNLARPIDLGRTFIAGSALDFVGTQAEMAKESGLMVRSEVVSTRARAQAAGLRRKILALLPQMEIRLVLDFAGVTVAASSFMDELLGRLVDELGEAAFQKQIEIVNMAPLVTRIANVVVEQRLKARQVSEAP